MKVKGTFVGTVEGEARVVSLQGKTPFLSFLLTSPEGEYTTKLECKEYNKDINALNAEAESIREGMTILVHGNVTARGFTGKKDPSKIYGALEMFIREKQILFHPANGPTTQQTTQPGNTRPAYGRQSQPAASAGAGTREEY